MRVTETLRSTSFLIGALALAAVLTAAPGFADEPFVRGARTRGLRPGEVDSRSRYGGGGFVRRKYTMEDFNRWAKQAAIKRLTAAQLDPETGLVAWPRVLMGRDYTDLRRDLDRLFRERAELGGAIDNETYDDILNRIDEMTYRLISTVRSVRGPGRTRAYTKARVFLQSLFIEPDYGTGGAVNVNIEDGVDLADR